MGNGTTSGTRPSRLWLVPASGLAVLLLTGCGGDGITLPTPTRSGLPTIPSISVSVPSISVPVPSVSVPSRAAERRGAGEPDARAHADAHRGTLHRHPDDPDAHQDPGPDEDRSADHVRHRDRDGHPDHQEPTRHAHPDPHAEPVGDGHGGARSRSRGRPAASRAGCGGCSRPCWPGSPASSWCAPAGAAPGTPRRRPRRPR